MCLNLGIIVILRERECRPVCRYARVLRSLAGCLVVLILARLPEALLSGSAGSLVDPCAGRAMVVVVVGTEGW